MHETHLLVCDLITGVSASRVKNIYTVTQVAPQGERSKFKSHTYSTKFSISSTFQTNIHQDPTFTFIMPHLFSTTLHSQTDLFGSMITPAWVVLLILVTFFLVAVLAKTTQQARKINAAFNVALQTIYLPIHCKKYRLALGCCRSNVRDASAYH